MADTKKFLDAEGVKHLWSKVNMQDYPNNETLMAVINAIDETKADKDELVTELSFNNIYFTYDSAKDNYAYIYGSNTSRGYTDFVFYIGDRYKVIFDGVEYDNLICSCWDDEYIGIGSSWYDSDNPAYPFGFVAPNVNNINRERRLDCYNMSDGDHTFSIYHYIKVLPQALVDKREYVADFIMWDEGDLYHTEDLDCGQWKSDIPYYVSINNEPFQIIYYLNENNDRNFSPYYHQDGRKTILRSNAYSNGNLHIWGESYSNYTESPIITFGRIIKKIDSIYIPWPDENDALELLSEIGMVEATAAADGSIYIEDTGVIYTL